MGSFGTIRSPRELILGCGQRRTLGRVAAKLGQRALVVTDPRLATDAQFLAMVADLEESGLTLRVESGTQPDVPVETTVAAAAAARDFAPDLVIGVGGGSCLDMAKCIALLLTHGGAPQDYYGELKVPGPVIPLIALPTTAGTGSEVTPVAVLSDSERQLKIGISSPHLIPLVAICDPELTVTCPPGGTPGPVYGSGPYGAGSSLCTAAVHAGRITSAEGGTVGGQVVDPDGALTGSTANGVAWSRRASEPLSVRTSWSAVMPRAAAAPRSRRRWPAAGP